MSKNRKHDWVWTFKRQVDDIVRSHITLQWFYCYFLEFGYFSQWEVPFRRRTRISSPQAPKPEGINSIPIISLTLLMTFYWRNSSLGQRFPASVTLLKAASQTISVETEENSFLGVYRWTLDKAASPRWWEFIRWCLQIDTELMSVSSVPKP